MICEFGLWLIFICVWFSLQLDWFGLIITIRLDMSLKVYLWLIICHFVIDHCDWSFRLIWMILIMVLWLCFHFCFDEAAWVVHIAVFWMGRQMLKVVEVGSPVAASWLRAWFPVERSRSCSRNDSEMQASEGWMDRDWDGIRSKPKYGGGGDTCRREDMKWEMRARIEESSLRGDSAPLKKKENQHQNIQS